MYLCVRINQGAEVCCLNDGFCSPFASLKMNRFYILNAAARTRKRALGGVSMSTTRSSTRESFWLRSSAFSSSSLREQEHKAGTHGRERTRVTGRDEDGDERSLRRKEEPQNKFLESLRRETVENVEQQLDDDGEEEDFKPPTRTFSLREKTFREKREQLNMPKEINGPRGLEPTRFKDWEVGGRCSDF